MTKRHCDRCDRIIREQEKFYIVIDDFSKCDQITLDICIDCHVTFTEWLNGTVIK